LQRERGNLGEKNDKEILILSLMEKDHTYREEKGEALMCRLLRGLVIPTHNFAFKVEMEDTYQ